jgi:FolB domain-containing protein
MNQPSEVPQDVVFVRNVAIQATVGLDCWQRDKAQPVILSFRVSTSIKRAGVSDNIEDTMDYRKIYKFLTGLGGQKFLGIAHVAETVCGWDQLDQHDHESVQCTIQLPKALLHSEGVVLECMRAGRPSDTTHSLVNSETVLSVRDLRISCIIGIGTHERIHKQPVIVSLKLRGLMISKLQNLASHLSSVYEVSPCKIHLEKDIPSAYPT